MLGRRTRQLDSRMPGRDESISKPGQPLKPVFHGHPPSLAGSLIDRADLRPTHRLTPVRFRLTSGSVRITHDSSHNAAKRKYLIS